ncbi:hypothetical protein PJV99_04545 [Aliarcobacter butzleri]|uniref:hypothetical protein n=1 Tax=Aliarcobacter butzleri TaxID=28197 RepID=UPI00263C203B|nr:hypothetical protein [Aliarcobacter butzleri]MDN5109397.1 hypothetical protein [Aliarcobacter butzleri]
MLKEEYEKELLKRITTEFMSQNGLTPQLNNISDIKNFFSKLSENQNNQNDKLSQYILTYIYYKFSEKEVRLRKVTSRDFEDFIGNIYNLVPTDSIAKSNPPISVEIEKLHNEFEKRKELDVTIKDLMLDKVLTKESGEEKYWSIAGDLCKNKREKSDILESTTDEDIEISIKTLKGKIDGDNANTEINIGSLSYRSLFIDIFNDNLGDRKAGLGSGAQMYKLLKQIEENQKLEDFKNRLKIFLDYLYGEDDFLIAYKSDKKMQIFFFEGKKLVNLLTKLLDKDIKLFSEIFYRWENNNLRIQINKLLNAPLSKIWIANNLSEIDDFPLYNGIENPFSKNNMVILNMESSLNNMELQKIIETSNKTFIAGFYEKILD